MMSVFYLRLASHKKQIRSSNSLVAVVALLLVSSAAAAIPVVVRLLEDRKLVFSAPEPAKDAPVEGPIVFSTDGTHPL